MYFRSSVLNVPTISKILADAWRSPNKSARAYWGLFPFDWQANWESAFDKLSQNGRPLVAPILQALILNRASVETLKWADAIARWEFNKIIPCHFTPVINATPEEFRQAFDFLELSSPRGLPEEDLETLRNIDALLYKPGIVPPPQAKFMKRR